MTEESLITLFVTSPEYYARVTQGSDNPDGAWLRSLYVNLLGRQAASAEVRAWLSVLPAAEAAGVAAAIDGSKEFRGNAVRTLYGAIPVGVIPVPDVLRLLGPATDAEVNGWVNTGVDVLSLEAAFLPYIATH